MKTQHVAMMLAFTAMTFLSCVVIAAETDSDTKKVSTEKDRLDLVVERNIFDRNRRPAPPVQIRREEPKEEEEQETVIVREITPRNPAADFVLKGVAMQAEERVAFIESVKDKSKVKLKLGDPIADGVIVNVDLDFIEFNQGEDNIRVAIGQCLDGSEAPTVGSIMASRVSRSSSGESSSTRSRLQYNREDNDGDSRSSRYNRSSSSSSRYSRESSSDDRDDKQSTDSAQPAEGEAVVVIEGADGNAIQGNFDVTMDENGNATIVVGEIPSEDEAAALRRERMRQWRERQGRD